MKSGVESYITIFQKESTNVPRAGPDVAASRSSLHLRNRFTDYYYNLLFTDNLIFHHNVYLSRINNRYSAREGLSANIDQLEEVST